MFISPAIATRGPATRTCTLVASALRRRSGAAAPAAAAARARLLDSFVSQDFIATWGIQYNKALRDTLERSRKQEVIRRGIKWFSRGLKTAEWACYFGVSAAIAATLAVRKPLRATASVYA